MFVRLEQVSKLVDQCDDIKRARVEVSNDGTSDRIDVKIECTSGDPKMFETMIHDIIKLRSQVLVVEVGSLPRDGVLVADLRETPA